MMSRSPDFSACHLNKVLDANICLGKSYFKHIFPVYFIVNKFIEMPDIDIKSYLGWEAKLQYMKTGSNKARPIVF